MNGGEGMTEPEETDPTPTLGEEHRRAGIGTEGDNAPAESDAEPPAGGTYGDVAQGTYADLLEGREA